MAAGCTFVGLEVSGTGITPELRARVRERVNAGGGLFCDAFSKHSDVLVVGQVGSAKHRAALAWGVPAVCPAWVLESEQAGHLLDKAAFRVGPFEGLSLCITGFQADQAQRAQLVSAIEAGKGAYSGVLVRHETSHLVAEALAGEKCRAALQWNKDARSKGAPPVIHIVTREWVEQCVEAGHWLPEQPFLLEEEAAATASADEAGATGAATGASTAVTAAAAPAEAKAVEEAAAAEDKASRDEKAVLKRRREAAQAKEREAQELAVKRLRSQEEREQRLAEGLQKSGEMLYLLDGYIVFLHGFDGKRWRNAQFLLTCLGASVVWEWNRDVTHVLVGDKPNKEYLGELKGDGRQLATLEMELLADCVEQRKTPEQILAKAAQGPGKGAAVAGVAADAALQKRPVAKAQAPGPDKPLGPVSPAKVQHQQQQQQEQQQQGECDAGKPTAAEGLDVPAFLHTLGKENRRKGRAKSRPARLNQTGEVDFSQALICVSRYTEEARSNVEILARKLGAKFTDRLTRNNPRVTHLISRDREGPKCKRAKQWRIPIHTIEWLEQQLALRQRRGAKAPPPSAETQAGAAASHQS